MNQRNKSKAELEQELHNLELNYEFYKGSPKYNILIIIEQMYRKTRITDLKEKIRKYHFIK